MSKTASTPLVVGAIVIVLAIIGFLYWRSQVSAPPTSQGVPVEAKPGAEAMQKLWQTGVKPKAP